MYQALENGAKMKSNGTWAKRKDVRTRSINRLMHTLHTLTLWPTKSAGKAPQRAKAALERAIVSVTGWGLLVGSQGVTEADFLDEMRFGLGSDG